MNYPPDILEAIAEAVYNAAQPVPSSSLDPLYQFYYPSDATDNPAALTDHNLVAVHYPTSQPAPYWPEATARQALSALCLVSRDFRDAARPWLWRRLEVNQPRNWLGILDAVCGEDPDQPTPPPTHTLEAAADSQPRTSNLTLATARRRGPRSKATITLDALPPFLEEAPLPVVTPLSPTSVLATVSPLGVKATACPQDASAAPSDHNVIEPLQAFGSVPHDLLSPPASRDPSPHRLRLRAASPGRWRFIKAVNQIIHREEPSLYVPTPEDPSPGRHVRHLDFNHFRTIGLRRSVGDGYNARFVTASRLERLLKEMPNLVAFGATEFMDSAVSKGVLEELLLRGLKIRALSPSSPSAHSPPFSTEPHRRRGRSTFSSPLSSNDFISPLHPSEIPHDDENERTSETMDDGEENEENDENDDDERRAAAKPLVALDLCGCVSTVFVSAMQAFVRNHNIVLPRVMSAGPTPIPEHVDEEGVPRDRKGKAREFAGRGLTFPALRRLGLRGVASLPSSTLAAFVLSFENLTHLDLSGTLVTDAMLYELGKKGRRTRISGMRLKSLALGRCPRLSGRAIVDFILGKPKPRSPGDEYDHSEDDDEETDDDDDGDDDDEASLTPAARARSLSPGTLRRAGARRRSGRRSQSGICQGGGGGVPPVRQHLSRSITWAGCIARPEPSLLRSASLSPRLLGLTDLPADSEHVRRQGGICDELEDLSLYCDLPSPSPLSEDELLELVSEAPCFQSGQLRYLDMSGCLDLSARVVERMFVTPARASGERVSRPGMALRSLGLSHIPSLPLAALLTLLVERAPNVEVLTLVESTPELTASILSGGGRANGGGTAMKIVMVVHAQIIATLCAPPFRVEGLHRPAMASHSQGEDGEGARVEDGRPNDAPTRLRVLELSPAILASLATLSSSGPNPNGTWTTVRSRGGRAWYVDASSAWVRGEFRRGLGEKSPLWREVRRLGCAEGSPPSSPIPGATSSFAAGYYFAKRGSGEMCTATSGSVGWHANKMEILHGMGMLGREDGLYGAVSFAYSTG